jgi:hypothetical protein
MIGAGKGRLTLTSTVSEKFETIIASKMSEKTVTTSSQSFDLNGEWKMKVDLRSVLDKNGTKTDLSGSDGIDRELGLQLSVVDNVIQGKLLWGSPQGMCAIGTLRGEVNGKSIQMVMTYTGYCCYNAKLTLEANYKESNIVVGTMQPINRPGDQCVSMWADFTMKRIN